MEVRISPRAQEDFDALPTTVKVRVLGVFERLEKWPEVSGARPLRKERKGSFRIRTGDYRVVFRPIGGEVVLVERVGHRKEIYE